MAETKAWLLLFGNQLQAAIGYHHMAEYIAETNVSITNIPLTFEYSPGVMLWNKQFIPLIDLALFIAPKKEIVEPIKGVIVIVYQDKEGDPLKYAGLILRASPKVITVSSEMGTALLPQFESVSDACFIDNDLQIPVLRLEQVFGTNLRDAFIQKIKKPSGKQKA